MKRYKIWYANEAVYDGSDRAEAKRAWLQLTRQRSFDMAQCQVDIDDDRSTYDFIHDRDVAGGAE